MLVKVALDPRVLSLNSCMDKNTIAARVTSIRKWREIQSKFPWVQILLPKSATRILQKIGAYPSPNSVRAALEMSNLSHVYSPNDLSRQIDEILWSAHLEENLVAEDALWSDMSVTPAFIETLADLNDETHRMLVLILINEHCCETSKKVSFASTVGSKELEVSAQADLVMPDTVPGFGPGDLPKSIAGKVSHFVSFEDVLDKLDPLQAWCLSDTNESAKLAIKLKMREIMKKNNEYSNWQSVPEFLVGEEFIWSVKRNQAGGNGAFASVTQEACAFAALRIAALGAEPFRASENSEEQRIRMSDKAKALRAHITGKGTGLRLMYWERQNKRIELANVGSKFELKISEGRPRNAV